MEFAVRHHRRYRLRLQTGLMGWGLGIRELDYTGFSGHSALSAAFWPIFLWLLSARISVGLRKVAVITGYVLAAVVGYSRLVIHAHSDSEVIAGLLLGAAGSALFGVAKRTSDPESVNISWGGVACGDGSTYPFT